MQKHSKAARAYRSLVAFLTPVLALTAHGALRAEDGQGPEKWTPALMIKVKHIGSVQVSPDGKLVAYAVREAVTDGGKSERVAQIHLAAADGSSSRQLTRGESSCDDPQWSPDGKWLAFASSRVGRKNLWLIRPDGGEAQQLSNWRGNVSTFKWSPDGKSIAFASLEPPTPDEEQRAREKNDARVVDEAVKLNRLYVVPVGDVPTSTAEARLLVGGALSVLSDATRVGRPAFDWSPDGRTIVFAHTRSPNPDDWGTADLSLVDVASGTIRPLVNTAAAELSPLYSPDGKSIAFIASDIPTTWGGTRKIHVVAAEKGPARGLADTHDGFGRYSELLGWSSRGDRVFFTELHGTSLRLMAMPLEGLPVELSREAGMSGGVFLNGTRTHFGFGWEKLNQPPEVFFMGVGQSQPVRVSSVHGDLRAAPLGRTEVVRWKSSEDFEIEGLLTYPVGYEQGKRYPLLLVVHGGPMGAFTQSYDATPASYPVAAFASQGYVVLRPNPRGSSGYGKAFRYANYNDWGGGDYRDVMTGVDHVIGLGVADPDRLGVMGWSYGGYMTSWIITQTKRFRAASVGAGITNLVSFTGTADIPGFIPDYFGGEFWNKADPYRSKSAMFHIQGVTTPTLIQHGERDERVPLSQGKELYNALKRQGCPTTMVIYPRTPHGIDEPRLLMDCMERNLAWFERYLKGSTP